MCVAQKLAMSHVAKAMGRWTTFEETIGNNTTCLNTALPNSVVVFVVEVEATVVNRPVCSPVSGVLTKQARLVPHQRLLEMPFLGAVIGLPTPNKAELVVEEELRTPWEVRPRVTQVDPTVAEADTMRVSREIKLMKDIAFWAVIEESGLTSPFWRRMLANGVSLLGGRCRLRFFSPVLTFAAAGGAQQS